MLCAPSYGNDSKAGSYGKFTSGNLTLTAGVDNAGRPYYSLRRGGEVILLPSTLGMKLKDGSLDSDFRVVAFARATKDETWRQHGEKKSMCATIITNLL